MSTQLIGQAFPPDACPPLFVTDDADFAGWLTETGLRVCLLDCLPAEPPESIVLIPLHDERLPAKAWLRERFRASRVLWGAIGPFDPSLPAARYFAELLLATDLAQAVRHNRDIVWHLLSAPQPFVFSGEGNQLTFSMSGENLWVSSRTRVLIDRGEHANIGSYTETGVSVNWSAEHEALRVHGTLTIEHVLAARSRDMPAEHSTRYRDAHELLPELKARLPLTVEIADGRIVPGAFGDIDDELRRVTNPEYAGLITELSFGTNQSIGHLVDWEINSQLNEGADGIHVAWGEGVTGAHLDFVCPRGALGGLDAGHP